MPTLGVSGKETEATTIHPVPRPHHPPQRPLVPTQNHCQPQTLYSPSPSTVCGTRGAMRNVRPRSSMSAIIRPGAMQAKTQQSIGRTPVSTHLFCAYQIRPTCPLSESFVVSFPMPDTRRHPENHTLLRDMPGAGDRPAAGAETPPSRRFPPWAQRSAFHAFQTLGDDDPAEPGKSGGES